MEGNSIGQERFWYMGNINGQVRFWNFWRRHSSWFAMPTCTRSSKCSQSTEDGTANSLAVARADCAGHQQLCQECLSGGNQVHAPLQQRAVGFKQGWCVGRRVWRIDPTASIRLPKLDSACWGHLYQPNNMLTCCHNLSGCGRTTGALPIVAAFHSRTSMSICKVANRLCFSLQGVSLWS